MPYRVIEYIPSLFFPILGIVKAGEEMKFSIGTIIEKWGVPIVIAVLSAWIAVSQMTYVLEERLTNHISNLAKHIANNNVHMEFEDKLKLFTTTKEFEIFKTDLKDTQETIQNIAAQVYSINAMIKRYSFLEKELQNYKNEHVEDHMTSDE